LGNPPGAFHTENKFVDEARNHQQYNKNEGPNDPDGEVDR